MSYKNEILDKLLIDFVVKLERGEVAKKKFPFTEGPVPVCGGLYCVKGDHMEKCQLAGIVGPGGDVPSFYSDTRKNDISNVNLKRNWRTPEYSKYPCLQ